MYFILILLGFFCRRSDRKYLVTNSQLLGRAAEGSTELALDDGKVVV